ncbi:MAG: DUF3108 domain-containing protein [Candidatus Marinimicrobia bacterium]|jgi:hypothetical protein|nr:DUF3108 domain-containing protein [Candidatus Neomarinimicrobiota bacterium]MBT3631652.1 DUF3108 domain-containing protein [Candidatus Neomarinimicrobiota bacterium]MBT3825853.1 DUF3108 domain-containing protein [Candidatus Neomarinimicrobiota bacterium]MBT4129950.1 DUF3108 domain-containing protein [Candidatus Neomarinimicrobiota bacterium]MBT4296064.1 DUF3108 domain-containing protein [Candidatus Neomarinimicrobiota bacterium]
MIGSRLVSGYKSYLITLLIGLGTYDSAFAGDTTVIPYEASYMGIPLLNMTLTWEELDSTIQITYDNQLKPFIAYFHSIHNIYRVNFDKQSYAPLSWSKKVSEGSMNFFLEATLSPGGASVKYSNGSIRPFPHDALTVFSATHFLASKATDPGFFPRELKVFIDGEIWNARATRYTSDYPHPEIKLSGSQVLIQTDLHFVGGARVMDQNDILMDVIASEGTRFLLWVERDGSYSKAQFGKFPRAVVLERLYK